jgi:hypothetical protein
MENVRNICNINLITDIPNFNEDVNDKCMSVERKLLRRLANPKVESVTVFNENLVCVHSHKTEVLMNKPIYVGMSILDISKVLMYDYHYNVMMKHYGPNKCRLLFTDTDSLAYCVETDTIYDDMMSYKDHLDTSEYNKDSKLYDGSSNIIGRFKDETKECPIDEFVGLKPKMYSFSTCNKEVKKAKGVARSVVENELSLFDYKDVLYNKKIITKEQNAIRSYKHEIYSIKQNKIALNGCDTKRYINLDGVSSYSYGHYKINEL